MMANNLVTDALPAIALGIESTEDQMRERPPCSHPLLLDHRGTKRWLNS